MATGRLYTMSAPSGAGKTSLVKALLQSVSGLQVSVSHTTRTQRSGEQHGEDYFFTERADFEQMVSDGRFLEQAEVFGNFYGTSKQAVLDLLEQGVDVLLEIDWQGAAQVRQQMPETISIFILPPSKEALQERLTARGQDNAEVITGRMAQALSEMSHYHEADYLVINDDFAQALEELQHILAAERLRCTVQGEQQQKLLASLLA
ncbi:MAG: guanylate kinase [Gammaproteobacteria bacterium]|nr:guanylate kinase [Gammaproteobacteria bacterium]